MTSYPMVLGEYETLARVCAGESLARYGDGEFKHAIGQCNVSQAHDARLSLRLQAILLDSGSCMVGIPNLNEEAIDQMSAQKRLFWWSHQRYAALLEGSRVYASAFISRPDSAPWINTPEYWQALASLWVDRDITLVRGRDNSKGLTASDLIGAREVTEILCPSQHAFAEYDDILERIGTPERVLLCLGPTATVMAVDLCAMGVHAVDLGHVALFWRKHLRGEPMTLSKDDKSHEKVHA